MKKAKSILSLLLIAVMLLTLSACGSDNLTSFDETEDDPITAEESGNTVYEENIKSNSLPLSYAGDFSDGRAWVGFYDGEGNEYVGLIDTNGNILYKTEAVQEAGGKIEKMETADGISFYTKEDGTSTLLDKTGKVISSSSDGVFDTVLACGGGVALAYKYEGPKNEKHICKIIDYSGKTLSTLEFPYKLTLASYCNCNMFYVGLGYNSQTHAIINSNTAKYQYVYKGGGNFPGYKFINNVAVMSNDCCPIDDPLTYSEGMYTQHPYRTITTDFKIKEYPNHSIISQTIVKSDASLPTILNAQTGNYFSIDSGYKNCTQITQDQNCYLLNSIGNYIVLVDSTGKEKFSAINGVAAYPDPSLANGVIIYNVEHNGFTFIDYSGNVLAKNLQYETVSNFSKEGLAAAKTEDDKYYYLDKSGNIVF